MLCKEISSAGTYTKETKRTINLYGTGEKQKTSTQGRRRNLWFTKMTITSAPRKKKRIMSETVFHKNRAHYVALPIVVENLSASLSSSNLLLEFFGGFDERNCLTTTPVTYCCDTKDTMVRPSSMLTNNIKWIKKQKQKHI